MGVGHSPDALFDFDPALLMGKSVDVFLDVFKKGVPSGRPGSTGSTDSASAAPAGRNSREQTIQAALIQLAERWACVPPMPRLSVGRHYCMLSITFCTPTP